MMSAIVVADMEKQFLTSDRLYLRALADTDLEGPYVEWLNDPEVCRFNSHHVFPYTVDAARAYVAACRTSRVALVLAICSRHDHRHLGNIALQQIDPVARSAEYAILLGDRSCWGQGFAKEASVVIIRHGFQELNLRRISCGTSAENHAMQRLAAFLGMREEGRRRLALFKHGRYADIIEYGLLRAECPAEFLA